MKPLLFKISMFFVCFSLNSQIKTVFYESINASQLNTLELAIKNIPLDVKKSYDDKVRIDFKLEFKNFSEREIDSVINQIELNNRIENKKLILKINSKEEISKRSVYIHERITNKEMQKLMNKILKSYTQYNSKKKTKKEIIEKHNKFRQELTDYASLEEKELRNKKNKLMKSFFTLYLPEKLLNNLNVKAKRCRFDFSDLELKNLDLFVDDSYLNILKLSNSKITCWNGSTFLGEVESSVIIGRSTTSIMIGEIANSNLITEYTKVEIGEIGKYNDIKDFNSKFYFYNYNDKFEKFDFKGEYSTIYFYESDLDYDMSCYGYDTTYFIDKDTIVSQPSKTGKKSKMMERKRKNNKPYSGEVNFDIVHTKFYYPKMLKK
ncbi:hypothetical protein [Tenacibaculum sp. 190524A05c]|uniref:hypothetical protein n=1 Tax=Tenacibaculum platacis TaxID=3137852 RepID=UPI0031FA9BC9